MLGDITMEEYGELRSAASAVLFVKRGFNDISHIGFKHKNIEIKLFTIDKITLM